MYARLGNASTFAESKNLLVNSNWIDWAPLSRARVAVEPYELRVRDGAWVLTFRSRTCVIGAESDIDWYIATDRACQLTSLPGYANM